MVKVRRGPNRRNHVCKVRVLAQYTTIRGIEAVQEGNIHFCNEGTSLNFQGFMEGGATEGVRVADNEIKNT